MYQRLIRDITHLKAVCFCWEFLVKPSPLLLNVTRLPCSHVNFAHHLQLSRELWLLFAHGLKGTKLESPQQNVLHLLSFIDYEFIDNQINLVQTLQKLHIFHLTLQMRKLGSPC